MSKLPAILATSILALTFFTGCSSPASSNPVSEDGFVTIPGGTYVVGCDEHGNGCKEVTIETFEMSQNPVSHAEWMICVNAGVCRAPKYSSNISSEPVVGVSLDMANKYSEWLSGNLTESYVIPSIVQLELNPHVSESLSSDCEVDSDFITLSSEQIEEYRLPSDFRGTYDIKNLKICHSGQCFECKRFSRDQERQNYFDSSTRLRTPFHLVKVGG